MRIGLLHLANTTWGGVYQYSLSVIEALIKSDAENQYIVISPEATNFNMARGMNTAAPPPEGFFFGKVLRKLYSRSVDILPIPLPLLIPFSLTRLGRWNKRENIAKSLGLELLVCPFSTLAGRQMKVPYIVVIHDLMHKYNASEERYSWKERVLRDFIYKRGARHSILTVVSYEWCKMDLHRLYGISLDKIRVVPEFAPPYILQHKDMTNPEVDSILKIFNLPYRYIFYPAHFWKHKNHINLVKALHRIKQEYQSEIPAVFVGSPKEAFKEVMSLVEKIDLKRQIFYLGYVSEREIVALYKKAVALVLPTLHAVSSIPIMEAMVLGTCCLCSNLPPMPEQVRDAGLLFDPYDEKDIAEKVWRIWNDDDLRQDLINKGKRRAQEKYTPEVFAQKWREIVKEAIEICHRRG